MQPKFDFDMRIGRYSSKCIGPCSQTRCLDFSIAQPIESQKMTY